MFNFFENFVKFNIHLQINFYAKYQKLFYVFSLILKYQNLISISSAWEELRWKMVLQSSGPCNKIINYRAVVHVIKY